VINGVTNATDAIKVGLHPYAIAADPIADVIYAVNYGDGTVTVIDGPTHATTTVAAGVNPNAVAVDPVRHKAYVTDTVNGAVTVIDGAANNAAAVVGTTNYVTRLTVTPVPPALYSSPSAIEVNPGTGMVYAADKNGGLVTIDVDRSQPVPLETVISPVSDPMIVSTANVLQTTNPAPRFTVNVTSDFTSTSVYNGITGATNPPPTELYYQVDGGGPWYLAARTSATGANPASFHIALSGQAVGPHTLYAVPLYGNQSASTGDSGAADVGNLSAYPFQIDPQK